MGETYQGRKGTLHVVITSASWVDISQLSVQLNGETIAELDASKQRAFEVEIDADRDSFVTVEVIGPANELVDIVERGNRRPVEEVKPLNTSKISGKL